MEKEIGMMERIENMGKYVEKDFFILPNSHLR
jgi:hypothetical protein